MVDNPFETHAQLYDDWYEANANAFESEVLAIQAVLPAPGAWVEIGVGTGRFADRLGIPLGVEPSEAMGSLARERGIRVLRARAEQLPLEAESMDAVFFVTTLCFVRDLHAAFREARRILRPGGHCVLGLLPSDSPLGDAIRADPSADVFFSRATLRTRDDVLDALQSVGMTVEQMASTLVGPPGTLNRSVQQPMAGHNRGSFVAIRAMKDPMSSIVQSQADEAAACPA